MFSLSYAALLPLILNLCGDLSAIIRVSWLDVLQYQYDTITLKLIVAIVLKFIVKVNVVVMVR